MIGWHTILAEETRHGPAVQARERGEAQALVQRADSASVLLKPKGVIGIVIAQNFPDLDLIREKLIEGIGRVGPDTVWVMREAPRAKHAAQVAWDTFGEFGIEPILAPLVPYWKYSRSGYVPQIGKSGRCVYLKRETIARDDRATMRDAELRNTCERIIVFHDKSSGVTAAWKNLESARAKIYVVERGKKKATPRKGRKPAGV